MQVKTYYDVRPDETSFYSVPDGTTVRLRENIEECEDGWCADEYTVQLKHCPIETARRRINANRALFLAQAIEAAQDAPSAPDTMEIMADHEERICLLELGV